MADDADKPDKPLDDNENLVKALESIKSLLATSETKLSQARESISQASAHSLKMTRDVPILDEVIIPGKSVKTEAPETAEQPEQSEQPEQPEPAPEPESKSGVDLTTLRNELEKELHDKLHTYANQLEEELKAKIQAYLDQHPS